MSGERAGRRLLIGTRKGLFCLTSDDREAWTLGEPAFLGSVINHAVADPRHPGAILVAASTGHLGPTVFRSVDDGASWTEAASPPAFVKREGGRTVKKVFWLTPGHASEPGVWYAGTTPHGLFRSEDGGASWEEVAGFNDHPKRPLWSDDDGIGGTPDGPITHSILIDPRDKNHMYLGLSSGGVFESVDQGADWRPLNKGLAADFIPTPDPEYGHDPHQMIQHPLRPDRLYQQNHCGIYRLDRPGEVWERVGDNMPREVGDIGFVIVAHPRDPDAVWVIPMDGTTVWPRTSVDGRPAVYRSRDAGASWERLAEGLPDRAWYNVKRQGFACDDGEPLGLYFGTSSGEVWGSVDEGGCWRQLAAHLPHIYSVEVA